MQKNPPPFMGDPEKETTLPPLQLENKNFREGAKKSTPPLMRDPTEYGGLKKKLKSAPLHIENSANYGPDQRNGETNRQNYTKFERYEKFFDYLCPDYVKRSTYGNEKGPTIRLLQLENENFREDAKKSTPPPHGGPYRIWQPEKISILRA